MWLKDIQSMCPSWRNYVQRCAPSDKETQNKELKIGVEMTKKKKKKSESGKNRDVKKLWYVWL